MDVCDDGRGFRLPPGDMLGGGLPWEWDGNGMLLAGERPLPGEEDGVLRFAGFCESARCAMLHSGRAAWECVLRGELMRRRRLGLPGLGRVLVPRFTCATVWEPLRRLGLRTVTYGVSRTLEPLLPRDAGADDVLLLTDYFGVSSEMVRRVGNVFPGLVVVDATMAFFSRYEGLWGPGRSWAAFYSVRKFAGVPDGGVALASFDLPLPARSACSEHRVLPLLLRRDRGALAAQGALEEAEAQLSVPALRMSELTRRLLRRVDWERCRVCRCANFEFLHRALGGINRLPLPDVLPEGPFCYPLVSGIPGLRDALVDAGVALPLLWPEVIEASGPCDEENVLARQLLPLPVDHRYGSREMGWLVRLILG